METLGVPLGGRWLDLGCGGGAAELEMARNGLFDHLVAYDPSPGAIEVARAEAARTGVTNVDFRRGDVNNIELAEAAFDVVHINMALHHVLELEHVVFQVNRSLRPGGVFIANEYVGPSQFQFSAGRLALVADCLAALPERLRWNPIAEEVKRSQPRYPRSWWDDFDPTESVRSDEIPRLFSLNFPAHRRLDYGGNLLNLVLENIAQNFAPDLDDDARLIDALFQAEDDLLREEDSDFAYFVCPKGSSSDLEKAESLAATQHGRFRRDPSDPLTEADFEGLRALAPVELETRSGSARPVLGPVIGHAKALVRRGLRFYLEPLARRQTAYNEANIEVLRRLVAELRAELAAREQPGPGHRGTGGDDQGQDGARAG